MLSTDDYKAKYYITVVCDICGNAIYKSKYHARKVNQNICVSCSQRIKANVPRKPKICYEGEDVIESMGECSQCKQYNLLGDGLCENCWDDNIESASIENEYIEQTINGKRYNMLCARCNKPIFVTRNLDEVHYCRKCYFKTKRGY